MFNYIFSNSSEYNEILQFVTLFLLFVIGAMIYYMSEDTEKLEKQITELELSCPENPECPQCPDLICSSEGKCPDCNCPGKDECPPCNANAIVNCPTVEDIVGGIFPGRNTGITSGGRYFDIQANESYELNPDYDYYQPMSAFPPDSILDPFSQVNPRVPPNAIDNTHENYYMNTGMSQAEGRMNMASSGEGTRPNQESQRWGAGSERTTGSNVDRQAAAARAAGGDVGAAIAAQELRDSLEADARSDWAGGAGGAGGAGAGGG